MAGTLPHTLAAVTSRRGSSHSANEDCYALYDEGNEEVRAARRGVMYAVADGVSSTPRGARAARIACDRLQEFFTSTRSASQEVLVDLVEAADTQVRDETQSASTLAGVWLAAGQVWAFSVGDSRIFRVRNAKLETLNFPDTRGLGLATYVGMGPRVRTALQIHVLEVRAGDIYLICSDGVVDSVGEKAIQNAFFVAPGARGLVEEIDRQLLQRGHSDDATVVAAQVLALER
jgi:serine/threonine protein phosphatase PrpC